MRRNIMILVLTAAFNLNGFCNVTQDGEIVLCQSWLSELWDQTTGYKYLYYNSNSEEVILRIDHFNPAKTELSFYNISGSLLDYCWLIDNCSQSLEDLYTNSQQIWNYEQGSLPSCCENKVLDLLCNSWLQEEVNDAMIIYGQSIQVSVAVWYGQQVIIVEGTNIDSEEKTAYSCEGDTIQWCGFGIWQTCDPDPPVLDFDINLTNNCILWEGTQPFPECNFCSLTSTEKLCLEPVNQLIELYGNNNCTDCHYEVITGIWNNEDIVVVTPPNCCCDMWGVVVDCQGNLLCTIGGIGGGDCLIDILNEIQDKEVIWDCSMPLPNCEESHTDLIFFTSPKQNKTNPTIWKMDLDGNRTALFDDNYYRYNLSVDEYNNKLVYVRTANTLDITSPQNQEICKSNLDGSLEEVIYSILSEGLIIDIDVFADNNSYYQIAYSLREWENITNKRDGDIHMLTFYNANGSIGGLKLTDNIDIPEGSLSFSTDGKELGFTRYETNWFGWPINLYKIDLTSDVITQIDDDTGFNNGVSSGSWPCDCIIYNPDYSKNGDKLVYSRGNYGGVWIINSDGSNPTEIPFQNQEYKDARQTIFCSEDNEVLFVNEGTILRWTTIDGNLVREFLPQENTKFNDIYFYYNNNCGSTSDFDANIWIHCDHTELTIDGDYYIYALQADISGDYQNAIWESNTVVFESDTALYQLVKIPYDPFIPTVHQVTLHVTDSNGCSEQFTEEIEAPPLEFLESFSIEVNDNTIEVTALPNSYYCIDQIWYDDGFSDYANCFFDEHLHVYEDSGTYLVCIYAFSHDECIDQEYCETIIIQDSNCQLHPSFEVNYLPDYTSSTSSSWSGEKYFEFINTSSPPYDSIIWYIPGHSPFFDENFTLPITAEYEPHDEEICMWLYDNATDCDTTICETITIPCTNYATLMTETNGNSVEVSFGCDCNVADYIIDYDNGGLDTVPFIDFPTSTDYIYTDNGAYNLCVTLTSTDSYNCTETICDSIYINTNPENYSLGANKFCIETGESIIFNYTANPLGQNTQLVFGG